MLFLLVIIMDYFDLHCDTAYECYKKDKCIFDNNLAVSIKKGSAFKKWKQVFAIWIKDDLPEPFLEYKKIVSFFKNQISSVENNNLMHYLALEGGAAIENISCINVMKQDGIKSITLTWNGKNKIASGVNEKGGLTCYGEKVINRMNDLNIATDLSHLNEESFYDAISVARYPIATHSNCKAVFSHKRNLTDEQLLKIAEKGGIVGICPYPQFLGKNSFEGILLNVHHFKKLGIEKSLAFGSDFDGALMDNILSDIRKIPDLFVFLRKNGVSEELCEMLFYKNAEEYFKKIDKTISM